MKLSEINPTELARETVDAIRAHIARVAFGLGPVYQWHETSSGDGAENTDLGITVTELTKYAQTGQLGWWLHHSEPLDACLTVASAYYGAAGWPGLPDTDFAADADPETSIGLVLVAAMARCTLAGYPPHGHADGLTARELAALSGLSYYHVTRLMGSGDIACSDDARGRVASVDEAKRWLRARGVEV
jgi:hypothetical protein